MQHLFGICSYGRMTNPSLFWGCYPTVYGICKELQHNLWATQAQLMSDLHGTRKPSPCGYSIQLSPRWELSHKVRACQFHASHPQVMLESLTSYVWVACIYILIISLIQLLNWLIIVNLSYSNLYIVTLTNLLTSG